MLVKLTIVHEGQTYVGEVEVQAVSDRMVHATTPVFDESSAEDYATKPSGSVELLYRSGFFKEPRRLPDVCAKLREDGYNFSRQSVFMALKAASFLALTGKRGSYSFVQKFPPRT